MCPWKCNQEPACEAERGVLQAPPWPPASRGRACRSPGPAGTRTAALRRQESLSWRPSRWQSRQMEAPEEEPRGGPGAPSASSPLRHLVAAQAGGSARSHCVTWEEAPVGRQTCRLCFWGLGHPTARPGAPGPWFGAGPRPWEGLSPVSLHLPSQKGVGERPAALTAFPFREIHFPNVSCVERGPFIGQ